MKNVNQRRKYVKINLHNDKGQRFVMGTALHETKKKLYPEVGAVLECGGELDFIKMDRDEMRTKIIDKNRRTLDQLYDNIVKKNEGCEGFAEKVEARMTGTEIKHPEDSMRSDG